MVTVTGGRRRTWHCWPSSRNVRNLSVRPLIRILKATRAWSVYVCRALREASARKGLRSYLITLVLLLFTLQVLNNHVHVLCHLGFTYTNNVMSNIVWKQHINHIKSYKSQQEKAVPLFYFSETKGKKKYINVCVLCVRNRCYESSTLVVYQHDVQITAMRLAVLSNISLTNLDVRQPDHRRPNDCHCVRLWTGYYTYIIIRNV